MRKLSVLLVVIAAACDRAPLVPTISVPAPVMPPIQKILPAPTLQLQAPAPASNHAQLVASTERARGRVVALLAAVEPLSGSAEMASRLDLARNQLDAALDLMRNRPSARDQRETATRRALLSLRAAPLSLSLFALDVPLAVRWNKLAPEVGQRLEQEAREVRRMIEETSASAERYFGPTS